MRGPEFIVPDWNAPSRVRAAVTTRAGGASRGPYASFNLGINTSDAPDAIATNRRLLRAKLDLAREPAWLQQVHGAQVVRADDVTAPVEADASWTEAEDVVCAVLTADCLPVLLCDRAGRKVAAAHGGWRGLAAGILENTLAAMRANGDDVLAWLGPAIGPDAFEVGPEVRAAFVDRWAQTAGAFRAGRGDRWFCDIHEVARVQLRALGVREIHGDGACTVTDAARFYSYRRDGETGRLASLIWMSAP